MLTGDGRSLKVTVLGLMAGLIALLTLLLSAVLREVEWPAAWLPEIEMPGPIPAGAAGPKGNPADWIVADDYPASAIREDAQGTTRFKLGIDDRGRPRICRILKSSGHTSLDEAACSAMLRRASFKPARDVNGVPIPSSISRRVVWRLPE